MVLRYWLRHLVQQKAGEVVREKMAEKVRAEFDRATGETAADQAESDEPQVCHVAVIFALDLESGGLEDLMEHTQVVRGDGFTVCGGRLGGRNVAAVRSGMGAEAAARATEALIQVHRPEWIISAGFAGGLVPEVARRDLIMADSVADLAGNRLAIDLRVDPAEVARMKGVHVGRLLTADRVIRLPAEKRELGEKHQALAVDMETYAVADVCRRSHARFLAVRITSDAVDDELPPDVEHLANQKTKAAQFGAAVGAIWNRPGSFKDMYRLRENALLASDRLAKFLQSTIEQLVPQPPEKERPE